MSTSEGSEELSTIHEALGLMRGQLHYNGRVVSPKDVQTALGQIINGGAHSLETSEMVAESYTEPGYEMVENQSQVGWLLESLTDRQREVVERIYGFRTGYPQVLTTIADAMGISYQAVQNLRTSALNHMRNLAKAENENE